MLTRAQKHNRDPRCVHHADQSPDHLAHGIAFADNKAIQPPLRTKGRVERPRLGHGIRTHQRLAHHEDLIGFG